ncbi:DNA-formamidopyrimidine glycosylase family protein [Arthrobacter sp. RAF14]|uniref:DNA-formamidopyrimidine glycosylase family protein n=1 Tax=Arthrobacter sp. RAF14 TaxID=3233051 RepID=UPI003F9046D8
MPEGDSVWRAASRLDAFLRGATLLASDFRVPRFATLDLTGWRTEEVTARGKHLLHRLIPPAGIDREGLTIHSHLKMEGEWQLYEPGERWRKPGHTARVVLRTERGSAVGFSLGILEVLKTSAEPSVVGHLGPDLLGSDWDPATAEANLRADPTRPLGLALLDQRVMAGIGNIYRNELCFLAGIHPAAPVQALLDRTGIPDRPDPSPHGTLDLPGVVAEAHRLLDMNRDTPARQTTSLPRGIRPAGGGSWPRYHVYRRARQPCLRCRTPLREGSLGEPGPRSGGPARASQDRVIYYCPRCQPLPPDQPPRRTA